MAVTGWSIHLPALVAGPEGLPTLDGLLAFVPGCPPEQAHTILGRKGLLYKEPSTRLALCAVHRALGLPDGMRPTTALCVDTAVVAASNLGNVQTVVEVARTVAREGGRGVSPMSAPNASSNVIASSVALWFGFGGPNLMVCSGATAGLDALALAALLIRAGRARRVVVVGAEPDDDIAQAVYRGGEPARAGAPALRAGAACVILQNAAAVAGPTIQLTTPVDADAKVEISSARPVFVIGPGGIDPVPVWGDCYGAQGVLQTALAAELVTLTGEPVGVRCGSGVDGQRTAWLGQPS
jgi:3-oxoacyl-[acyl-carrier-protein] synthase II